MSSFPQRILSPSTAFSLTSSRPQASEDREPESRRLPSQTSLRRLRHPPEPVMGATFNIRDPYAAHRATVIESYPEKSGHLLAVVKHLRSGIERELRSPRPSKKKLVDLLAYIDSCMVPCDRFDAALDRRQAEATARAAAR